MPRHLTDFDFPSKHNLSATTNPAVSNDSSQGYEDGSIWVNTSTDAAYICSDNSVGAAVWKDITASGGGGGGGDTAPITIGWDGQGGFITTGLTRYFVAPYNATITGWSIVATGTSPTCTIDVWKIASGTALPTVANTITAAAIPALSTGNVIRSSTLTGWTTAITAGDILAFNIDAVSNALTIKINLEL